MFIGLKKDLFGVFLDIEGDKVTMTMKTGMKEGRRNRNVKLQCFPYTRLHALFA